MPSDATVHLTKTAYQGMLSHIEDLEDRVAALESDDGSRIPHPVALAIIRGDSPIAAFRTHHAITLRQLARRTGISPSHLSEIERRRKPGSAATLAKVATTVDTLLTDSDLR